MVCSEERWCWDDAYEVLDAWVVHEVQDSRAGTRVLPDFEAEFGWEVGEDLESWCGGRGRVGDHFRDVRSVFWG